MREGTGNFQNGDLLYMATHPVAVLLESDERSRMTAAILNLQRDQGFRKGARMERLTIDEIIEHCDRKARMYEKACDIKYLETTAMSNSIKEYWEYKQVAEYLKKLKEYEDLEEQGLLLRLPCKAGDKIYQISENFIEPCTVETIFVSDDVDKDGNHCNMAEIHYSRYDCPYTSAEIYFTDIGKTVFLTQEEAEAKLTEMEGSE